MSDMNKMKLTKDQILKADDLPTQEVEVPEWGGMVKIRSLSGKERDSFEDIIQKRKKGKDIELKGLKVLLLALTIINEDNSIMFSEEDLEKLNAKSAKALNRVFDAVTEMNGIGEAAVEDLRKNLPGVPSDANGSD